LRARYCAAQVARFAFFLTQSTAVTVWGASGDANNRRLPIEISTIVGALTDAILKEDQTDFDLNVPLKDKPSLIPDEQRQLFNKNFQAIIDLIKTDLRNIEDGKYALPYDLEPSYAPQWSPLPVIGKINQFLSERDEVMERVVNRKGMEIRENFIAEKSRYPRYYLQNFHYQSNGWLSDKSARVYDYQVESIFMGMADAMRRQSIPAFAQHLNSIKASGTPEKDIKVLDVATGTGRYASFLMQNFPEMKLDVLDLSPFYLAEARKLLGKYKSVTYVEAAAEKVPSPEAEYDAITNVYLFHELPRPVRKQVVKEWFRVLKPGGKLFFVDSAQESDVPYSRVLEGFVANYHEPYYMDYTKHDLKEMFEDAGFKVDDTEVHWVSKVMVMTKPAIGADDVEEEAPAKEEVSA